MSAVENTVLPKCRWHKWMPHTLAICWCCSYFQASHPSQSENWSYQMLSYHDSWYATVKTPLKIGVFKIFLRNFIYPVQVIMFWGFFEQVLTNITNVSVNVRENSGYLCLVQFIGCFQTLEICFEAFQNQAHLKETFAHLGTDRCVGRQLRVKKKINSWTPSALVVIRVCA